MYFQGGEACVYEVSADDAKMKAELSYFIDMKLLTLTGVSVHFFSGKSIETANSSTSILSIDRDTEPLTYSADNSNKVWLLFKSYSSY